MKTPYLRLAKQADFQSIQHIIKEAQVLLRQEKIDQWQNGQPSISQLQQDIKLQQGYVLVSSNQVIGTAVLLPQPDPNYANIEHGHWHNNQDSYLAIHRLAIRPQYQGQHLSQLLFSNLITVAYNRGYHNLRIDTHFNNLRMQHIIKKIGFTYRGIIKLINENYSPRFAYELNLSVS